MRSVSEVSKRRIVRMGSGASRMHNSTCGSSQRNDRSPAASSIASRLTSPRGLRTFFARSVMWLWNVVLKSATMCATSVTTSSYFSLTRLQQYSLSWSTSASDIHAGIRHMFVIVLRSTQRWTNSFISNRAMEPPLTARAMHGRDAYMQAC